MHKRWMMMGLALGACGCEGPLEPTIFAGAGPVEVGIGEDFRDEELNRTPPEIARPDEDPNAARGPARLRGRVSDAAGYQSIGQFRLQPWQIDADRVRLINRLGETVADVAIQDDGRFEFVDLRPLRAPFMVEAYLGPIVAGRSVVTHSLQAEEERALLPLSLETSVEADVFSRLAADGIDVDPGVLRARISQEMAQHCGVESLAVGVWQADLAFKQVLGEGDIFAGTQRLGLRLDALRTWQASIVAGEAGWSQWQALSNQALFDAGLTDDMVLRAHLAAGLAQSIALDDGTCRAAGLSTASELLRGTISSILPRAVPDRNLQAQLSATVTEFAGAIMAAESVQALAEAQATFSQRLLGVGQQAAQQRGEPQPMAQEAARLGDALRAVLEAVDTDAAALQIADAINAFADGLQPMVDADPEQRLQHLGVLQQEAHPLLTAELAR